MSVNSLIRNGNRIKTNSNTTAAQYRIAMITGTTKDTNKLWESYGHRYNAKNKVKAIK